MATTKITNPELFDLGSLDTALKLPSGTTAERPTSPSTGEWRYNTTTNLVEFWDGGAWRELQSENLPPIPSENFNVVLYTGTGSAQSITGVGFKPDMVWIKDRIQAYSHNITDTTRGTSKQIFPNSSNAQDTTYTNRVTSFDADGFTIGNDNYVNTNGNTFVAWCWKANGGTTSSNTDGNITSTVQVNEQAGFSIIQYTSPSSPSSSTDRVGHGLGTTPAMVIVKRTDGVEDWYIWHKELGGGGSGALNKFLRFNTDAQATASNLFNTVNSTVVNLSYTSTGNLQNIAYAFAEVEGFSKFGSYTGNGSTNGPIVETGFEPAFIMFKQTNDIANWCIVDNKRSTTNPRNKTLRANSDASEATVGSTQLVVDFLSNGFQLKQAGGNNVNGGTFIYIAFASDPSAAPVLADSFANKLYTGTGVDGLAVTGLGFQPSMVWIKNRGLVRDHNLADIVQGVSREITPNTTEAQENRSVTSFDSDGFTLDSASGNYNANGDNYVAWNWKANPIPNINTDGTIQSIAAANQAAGFSIVSYTGDGTSGSTVGHNLGTTPEVVIYKRLDATASWIFKSTLLNTDDYLALNLTDQVFSDSGVFWNGTAPTSTVFTLGNSASVNTSSANYIAYCFASISGFSKFGTYTGNGSTQSITGLGFQPNWVLIKEMSASESWRVFDSARGATKRLFPNTNSAESTAADSLTAFDSDGFSLGSSAGVNQNTQTYIYMAFKENPTP